METARVTFKEGDKGEPSNYRPISVLPVPTRLLEKLIFNQLHKYLNDNNLDLEHSTLRCLAY